MQQNCPYRFVCAQIYPSSAICARSCSQKSCSEAENLSICSKIYSVNVCGLAWEDSRSPRVNSRVCSLATTLFPPQFALHPKSAHQYVYCALQGGRTMSGRFEKPASSNFALQIGPSHPTALKRPFFPAHPSCLRDRGTSVASAAALLLGRRTVCQISRRLAPLESEFHTGRTPHTAPGAHQTYLAKCTQNRVPPAPEVLLRWSLMPPPHLPFDSGDM